MWDFIVPCVISLLIIIVDLCRYVSRKRKSDSFYYVDEHGAKLFFVTLS